MCQYLSDLSIAIIGAIVGIGGAFYIFQETIQTNRKIDREKQEEYQRNRMRFIVNLLREVLEKSKEQISHFETQGNSIKDNPFKIHYPQLLASNQMDRLNGIDSQSVFEGYVLLFGDSEETVKSYNKMFYQIDFLDKRMHQLMQSNEKNIMSIAQDQEQMRLSVDDLYSRFPEFYDFLGKEKYYQMMESFNKYIGTGEVDIRSLHNEFLIPLFKEVQQMQESDQNRIAMQGQLIILIRNCTSRIEHLKVNNINYAEEEAMKIGGEVKNVFASLENITTRLEKRMDS
ncbi:hypothetical protein [Sphingobacterium corticibacterium]|uniref:Uncharacterized protein n=1 Tax=Sphingobacterium corticibacterium TaxID=2484746 RepID=A0A4Q6XPP7_9SPHI|nr:hypothetical protein [Sphingobacterium corticibacterium]RZF62200.1 hypothetical protein EWE74_05175 [Sphingobacterium corticibacterium]